MSEAVTVIRRLWTEDFVEHGGEYYRVKGATVYDRPEQPVPIYVAATGEGAARLAGRRADGFICTSGKGMELYRDSLLPAVREGATAAGRDYVASQQNIEHNDSFDPDKSPGHDATRTGTAPA